MYYNISILRVINNKKLDIKNRNNGYDYCEVLFNGSHYELISNSKSYYEDLKNKTQFVKVKLKDDTYDKTVKDLIYKVQKEILNPMETAFIYQEICEFTQIKQIFLSEKVKKSQGTISNKLRLLKLPIYVQHEIIKGTLKERHGRALLQFKENINDIKVRQLVIKAIESNMRVSDFEDEINKILGKKTKVKITKTLNKLENKRNLKNRQALLCINQFEQDLNITAETIKKSLPSVEIDIEHGILENDYIFKIKLKEINKEN